MQQSCKYVSSCRPEIDPRLASDGRFSSSSSSKKFSVRFVMKWISLSWILIQYKEQLLRIVHHWMTSQPSYNNFNFLERSGVMAQPIKTGSNEFLIQWPFAFIKGRPRGSLATFLQPAYLNIYIFPLVCLLSFFQVQLLEYDSKPTIL